MSAYAHEAMALHAGDRRLRSVRAGGGCVATTRLQPGRNGNTNARSAVTPRSGATECDSYKLPVITYDREFSSLMPAAGCRCEIERLRSLAVGLG